MTTRELLGTLYKTISNQAAKTEGSTTILMLYNPQKINYKAKP
jgi:hypothetical protein